MSPGEGKIAVVGLGGMGGGIARRLLSQGFPVVVYNRDAAKAEPLAEAGATVARSLGEVARDAWAIVLSLSDEHAVLEVLDGGLVAGLSPGALLLDATTVSPGFATAISERLAALGILRVEICVVGNPAMAASGELRVFTAGDRSVVAKADPVLSAISQHLSHVGSPGAATTLKLAFNILLGAQVTALAEAVALGESAGMDRDVLLDKITGSGFSSAVLAFRAEFMRRRSYTPAAFRTQLMEKDLRLACTSAAEAGIELSIAKSARSVFADAVVAGHGASDVSVVLELATAGRGANESGRQLR